MLMGCCRGVWVAGERDPGNVLESCLGSRCSSALSPPLWFLWRSELHQVGQKTLWPPALRPALGGLRGLYRPQQPVHGPVVWYVCVMCTRQWCHGQGPSYGESHEKSLIGRLRLDLTNETLG